MQNFNPNFRPLSGESKVIVLLLVIFLFGILILNVNRKKPCGCTRRIIYRERKLNPRVITKKIPAWAVQLKRRNTEMFGN
jgi:hypothetical protein